MSDEAPKPPYHSIKISTSAYDSLRLIAAVKGKLLKHTLEELIEKARKILKI